LTISSRSLISVAFVGYYSPVIADFSDVTVHRHVTADSLSTAATCLSLLYQ